GFAVTTYELEVIARNGEEVTLEVSSRPILNGGRPIGVQGIARDVTERKRAEEKLRDSEALYHSLVECLPIAVFRKDLQGRFTFGNNSFCQLLGRPSEEILGQTDFDFSPAELAQKYQADDRRVMETREVFETIEEHLTRSDGTRTFIQAIKAPVVNAKNEVIGVQGILWDVTGRKRAEEELRRAMEAAEMAARAKGEFLANMSHEIRTPMNAIIGMTNLLLDTALSEEQRDFASTVKGSADGLLTIINDILDFSKMEAGKLHFEILNFNLREAVETTVELLSERAAQKKLEIASFVPEQINSFLRGDPGR